MKIVYGVPYIEVEFGQRDEGWCLYMTKAKCIRRTKKDSESGPYDGGYYGPERPLYYIEIPFDSLEKKYRDELEKGNVVHTLNNWHPKFKGARVLI